MSRDELPVRTGTQHTRPGVASPRRRGWVASGLAGFEAAREFFRGRRGRVIAANTAWLTAALGISSLADFLVVVYVTRVFGAAEYGKFAFALAFASLFASFFDFGLSMAVTREFARDPLRARDFPNLLLLKGLLGVAVLVPIAAGALVISPSGVIRTLIIVLSAHIFLMEMLNLGYALFRSRQRMDLEARFRFMYAVTLGVLVVSAMAVRPSVAALGVAYVGTSLTTLAALLVVLVRTGTVGGRPAFRLSVWREFLGIGLYVALAKVAGDVITYAAPVMLGALGRVAETAWYYAAAKVYGLVLFPMGLITSAVFPALVSIHQESDEEFSRYWTTWAEGTIILSVLLSALVVARAPAIVAVIYPADFAAAAGVLQVMIVAAALIYVHTLYFHALLIFDEQRSTFRTVFIAAACSVALNALLTPRYGPVGAAWALAATHAVILGQYVVVGRRHAPVRRRNRELLATAAMASAAGVAIVLVLRVLSGTVTNLFLSLALGVVVYGALLAVLLKGRIGRAAGGRI